MHDRWNECCDWMQSIDTHVSFCPFNREERTCEGGKITMPLFRYSKEISLMNIVAVVIPRSELRVPIRTVPCYRYHNWLPFVCAHLLRVFWLNRAISNLVSNLLEPFLTWSHRSCVENVIFDRKYFFTSMCTIRRCFIQTSKWYLAMFIFHCKNFISPSKKCDMNFKMNMFRIWPYFMWVHAIIIKVLPFSFSFRR